MCKHAWYLLGHLSSLWDAMRCRNCGADILVACPGTCRMEWE